jgi:lipoprotein-anchoring transpeptidase ErfK/SrfK
MAKSILIELRRQKLFGLEGGSRRYEFHCATGDRDHQTPTGEWRIIRKHRFYTSQKYKVRMDYAMFFTSGGEAIHESNMVIVTSYLKTLGLHNLGSKGCVRLASDNARELFNWAPMNTKVRVTL